MPESASFCASEFKQFVCNGIKRMSSPLGHFEAVKRVILLPGDALRNDD